MKDTKKYWFKRRLYGFGWTPTCWQGWATVIVFLAIFVGGKSILKDDFATTFSNESNLYFVILLIAIIGLVITSIYKGPKPKWRWGKSKDDNPSEDI